MKAVIFFAGLAAAHSAVRSITIDGNLYPARNVVLDRKIGVKRIEWNFDDVNNFPAMAVTDVTSPAIACGLNPRAPELTAVARAGANVTVQWTGIVKMHNGPVMSYLGAYTPGQKPQDIKFFKIEELGFDKARQKWANEDLIKNDHTDSFLLPSDIKPGLYVLRTELLALHGNMAATPNAFFGGPQFYTHCYNIQISGDGTAEPEGVTFPGAYKPNDPGVIFRLSDKAGRDNYIIPGPPKYNGKYVQPTGPGPVIAPKDRGVFDAEFEAKYQAVKKLAEEEMYGSINAVNGEMGVGAGLADWMRKSGDLNARIRSGVKELQQEAIKRGYTDGIRR